MRVLYSGSNAKKNSGEDPNKIEARFAQGNYKIYDLKIKLQTCWNIQGKLSNLEQIQMEYWEMDIWKGNEYNFFNEEVEKFTSR